MLCKCMVSQLFINGKQKCFSYVKMLSSCDGLKIVEQYSWTVFRIYCNGKLIMLNLQRPVKFNLLVKFDFRMASFIWIEENIFKKFFFKKKKEGVKKAAFAWMKKISFVSKLRENRISLFHPSQALSFTFSFLCCSPIQSKQPNSIFFPFNYYYFFF